MPDVRIPVASDKLNQRFCLVLVRFDFDWYQFIGKLSDANTARDASYVFQMETATVIQHFHESSHKKNTLL